MYTCIYSMITWSEGFVRGWKNLGKGVKINSSFPFRAMSRCYFLLCAVILCFMVGRPLRWVIFTLFHFILLIIEFLLYFMWSFAFLYFAFLLLLALLYFYYCDFALWFCSNHCPASFCFTIPYFYNADIIFRFLRTVENISDPAVCSSTERCILAYLYYLYISCTYIKVSWDI